MGEDLERNERKKTRLISIYSLVVVICIDC